MPSKKNQKATTNTTNQPALRIGTRVRSRDDAVLGRIIWANAVSVKIKWDDNEQLTCRRDALASKAIEILDADDEQATAPASAVEETAEATEPDQLAPAAATTRAPIDADQLQLAAAVPSIVPEPPATTEPSQPESEATPAPTEPATTAPATSEPQAPTSEPTAPEPTAASAEVPVEQTASSTPDATAGTVAKAKRQRKAPAEPKEKKLSALDAAAKVLAEAGQAMNAQEMIQAMANKGYWTSPGGKTPAATIYAAIISEIKNKGADARFVKTERGKFGRTPSV